MKDITLAESQDRNLFIQGLKDIAKFYIDNPDVKLPYLITPTIAISASSLEEGWKIAKALGYSDKEVIHAGGYKHYHWQARFGNILVGVRYMERTSSDNAFPEPAGDHDSPAATATLS
jgi:hypothetical protein